jgi:trimethylamine:corrinoid methyltransferase-like protein
MMRPKLNILSDEPVSQIIAEEMELLMGPGVRAHSGDALSLLARRKAG